VDKLRALSVFVAIVDNGSLTAAASALSTSLPAVVRQLASLEAEVGVRLLNRTTRRLSLTEDGRQYLERVRRILSDLDEADRALSDERAEPSGSLYVTAPVLFGSLHVAPAVHRFLTRYPKMRINLLLVDRIVNLVEEGVDVGVRIAPLSDSTLVAQSVGKVRQVVVASPALLKKRGVPRHPRELAAQNCVRFSPGSDSHWSFSDSGRLFQVAVKGNLSCNLVAPALDACASGLGFGSFLSYQVAALLRAKRLRIVLAEFEPPVRSVALVYPSARLLPGRTRNFLSWMRAALKESSDSLAA